MSRLRERPREWWRGVGSPSVRALLLLILFVGGGLRVAWVAHAGVAPRFGGDPASYLLLGETIASGNGYTNPFTEFENVARRADHQPLIPRQPFSFYPPGYPVFVAAVVWVVWHTPIPDGDVVRAVGYAQALLGVLTILMAFALARKVFDTRIGLVAAAIVALFPNLITTTATLQLETFVVAVSLAMLLVLLPSATREDPRAARLVVGGALMGAAVLVRPTILLFLVAFAAARAALRRPWRETVSAVAIVLGAAVAVVAPWTVRNAVALHAFVPVSTNVGSTICPSRNPEATGGFDTGILERQCVPPHATGTPSQQDVAANTYGTHQAIHWVLAHPLQEVKMWFWRGEISYASDSSGLDEFGLSMDRRWASAAKALSDGAAFVVLGFAAVGIAVARRRRPAGTFLLVAALAYAAVPIILQGDPRYRVPADPLLVILAAAGLCAALDGARRATSTPEPERTIFTRAQDGGESFARHRPFR
ncbi:MAG TPA: glycosyltransferase family 39 protein [Acidimicrobiia bacterium]